MTERVTERVAERVTERVTDIERRPVRHEEIMLERYVNTLRK